MIMDKDNKAGNNFEEELRDYSKPQFSLETRRKIYKDKGRPKFEFNKISRSIKKMLPIKD